MRATEFVRPGDALSILVCFAGEYATLHMASLTDTV